MHDLAWVCLSYLTGEFSTQIVKLNAFDVLAVVTYGKSRFKLWDKGKHTHTALYLWTPQGFTLPTFTLHREMTVTIKAGLLPAAWSLEDFYLAETDRHRLFCVHLSHPSIWTGLMMCTHTYTDWPKSNCVSKVLMDAGTTSSTMRDVTDKSKDIVITAKVSPDAMI